MTAQPVTAGDLNAEGAMTALLKDALKPNLVQTLEHTPAFVHGGPFANIAHGCNSVTATRMAMKLADYVVTEAGFGADLGAEKFLDIKCRMAGLTPSAVVVVATVRALKHHGGVPKATWRGEPGGAGEGPAQPAAACGEHHPGLQAALRGGHQPLPAGHRGRAGAGGGKCSELGVNVALSEVWAKGGEGGMALAKEVIRLCDQPNDFTFSYELDLPIKEKIRGHCHEDLPWRRRDLHRQRQEADQAALTELGFDEMPICMAKTQYSFSDDPTHAGRAEGLHRHRAEREGLRRRRLHRGPHRRHHDHARPAARSPLQSGSTWMRTARSPACSK